MHPTSKPIVILTLVLGILTIAAATFGVITMPTNFWDYFLIFVGVFIVVREIFILARWNKTHPSA